MSDERPPADVRFQFDHDDGAPRLARDAVAPLLEPEDPIAGDVTLTVSELVTNVIKHTEYGGLLEAWDPKPDVPLRVEVTDSDSSPVEKVLPRDNGRFGGHGLHIVESVADKWGVTPTENGKTVWAEFDRVARQEALPSANQ